MATKVHMEALSPTMEEGQVVRWLKSEGDEVSDGDILAEIETDKATMELVARGSGVLRKQLLGEGDTAPVGAVIGVIAGPDEDISDVVEEAGEERAEPEAAAPEAEEAAEEEAAAPAGEAEKPQAEAGVEAAAEAPAAEAPT
ncbi:MAG: biotin/lipoyl-containing protein, partial [Gemmatimonadota bacterium]